MRVTKQLRTETGHRLVDYDGRCAHLHGHSYLWEVTVEAQHLTQNGMVTDFKELKQAMNQVLDPLDHAMVLAPDDKLVTGKTENGLLHTFNATNGEKGRLHIWHDNPTAESFAKWAANEIQKVIWEEPDFIDCTVVKVRVWETANSYAEWNLGEDEMVSEQHDPASSCIASGLI